ncbi:MAG: DNA polymerase III subunit gamma/tau [Bacilli bacterium]|nr:DNA polymerase III subunit gamma/tau [Bacilli bacterium]
MSYKVLYRKYRPSNFNDIVDQKFITDTLKESIINNKISHAYIFSGPKGTGKTSTAKVFAKAINCVNPKDGEPCGKCDSCLNFDKNPDIIELDAASNNKVEDIREIVNNVKLAPAGSKYKIYIIDEVHMLTPSAANAFLLTLEEPPSHAIFILATTNPESLPQTILSRCQQFAFSKISKKALVDRINYVLQQEKMELDDDVVKEIADLSDGGLRDALSILDQLITLNKPINADLLNEQFGIVSESVIVNLVESIINNDVANIKKIFDSLKEFGFNEKSFVSKFISVLTNKICSINDSSKVPNLKNIVFETIKIDNFKVNFNYYDVIKMIIVSNLACDNVINDVSDSNNILDEKKLDNNDKTEIIVEKEEKNISQEINNEVKETNNLPSVNNNLDIINIRINNSFANANKKMKSDLEKNLSELIEKLKNDSDIYSLFIDTEVGVVSATNILFVCDSDASAKLLNEKESKIIADLSLDKKIVFVDKNKWNELVSDYKDKTNKKIKYEYIEEPKLEEKKSEIEDLANNIFGENNIVVEE